MNRRTKYLALKTLEHSAPSYRVLRRLERQTHASNPVALIEKAIGDNKGLKEKFTNFLGLVANS
jgi:hypothetical protein